MYTIECFLVFVCECVCMRERIYWHLYMLVRVPLCKQRPEEDSKYPCYHSLPYSLRQSHSQNLELVDQQLSEIKDPLNKGLTVLRLQVDMWTSLDDEVRAQVLRPGQKEALILRTIFPDPTMEFYSDIKKKLCRENG